MTPSQALGRGRGLGPAPTTALTRAQRGQDLGPTAGPTNPR